MLERRYVQPGESVDDVLPRVARAVAEGEPDTERRQHWGQEFEELLTSLKFLPNSPTIRHAGTGKGCLSACFVISPEDSMGSIMRTAYEAAMVEKWGGGIGFGFSKLRPKGDHIRGTHGVALGVVSTMKIYSTVGNEMTQGAFRMGAHMGQLRISHPEIRDFIHAKDNDDAFQNFNISVQLTDDFMEAVKNDDYWDLFSPHDWKVWETVPARELWDEICQSAWKTGDPGVVFMDRVWETQPNPQLGQIESSNPCGEEFLEQHGNCCLGSIDLAKHIRDGKVAWGELARTIRTAVRFLDDVIEINEFPSEVPELRETNLRTRRIGLGVMGWADALMLMGIPYDSDEAVDLAAKLSVWMRDQAWEASEALASERGSFPDWENSALKDSLKHPIRNSSVFTIAPTGSISMIAGCSSGIEPHFARVNTRQTLWNKDGATEEVLECIPLMRKAVEDRLGGDAEDFLWRLARMSTEEADRELHRIGIDPDLYRGALQIEPKWHVRHLAAWQKGATNSVSKTINLPEHASPEDVGNALWLAWELGVKAVTVYRDKSKGQQVLNAGAAKPQATVEGRPDELAGSTRRIQTGHGALYVTVNRHPETQVPFETFATLGKSGGDVAALMEALGRLSSTALRAGVPPDEIGEQLSGISCGHVAWVNGQAVLSAPDAFGKALLQATGNGVATGSPDQLCQQCGGVLRPQEGCMVCESCNWTKCD